jgi:dTMP kinase
MLINIDGPDGVGKSTLIRGLLSFLLTLGPATFIHFPRYDTAIGNVIRQVLDRKINCEPRALQMLYSVDRINFAMYQLMGLQQQYKFVLVDRYTTSGIVYGKIDNISPMDILFFERDIVKPVINLVLIAEIEHIMERLKSRGNSLDKFEDIEFQKTALQHYKEIHTIFPNTVQINAEQSIAEVLESSIRILKKYVL